MISLVLKLKRVPDAVHNPAAWFLPGDNPAEWLEEIASWAISTRELRLFVVPAGVHDRRAEGVLVVPSVPVKPQGVRRGILYGVVAGRLFVPVDAVLQPPVTDAELRAMLPMDVYVLHPIAGLIGFARDEGMHVHQLIEPLVQRDTVWDRAAIASSRFPRLIAVEPEETPGIDVILQDARDDIGKDSTVGLPPADGESKIGEWAKRAAVPSLHLLSAMAGNGRLGEWASKKAAAFSRALDEVRFRELERLRKMLEKQPDEGLRHAIPLRDIGARGIAPPGNRLTPRNVNFNLSQLFGGGRQASDSWQIPPDMYQRLQQQYREAANRELRIGRFRRAAYVFAELLGDFTAAANALEQGRHFREAAVLYRDRIKDVRKAAECLERGGLLPEAIALYEELHEFEKVGDLHAVLEQFAEAEAAYRSQVHICIAHQYRLDAARLLEKKLNAPDEALAILSDAWPSHDASGECLRESFALLARVGRHDESIVRLTKLRAEPAPVGKGQFLTQVLEHVASTYPEAGVRALSSDATRVVAGNVLPAISSGDRHMVARAVARLVPDDRLLARDVERYLANPMTRPPQAYAVKSQSVKEWPVLRKFRLPGKIVWLAAAAGRGGFFALGSVNGALIMTRGKWDGLNQTAFWRTNLPKSEIEDTPWQLHPVPGQPLVTVFPTLRASPPNLLPRSDHFDSDLRFTTTASMSYNAILALTHDSAGLTWLIHASSTGDVALAVQRSDTGILLESHALSDLRPSPTGPVAIAVHSGQIVGTWGDKELFTFSSAAGLQRIETPDSVLPFVATSSATTKPLFAVPMQEDALLISPAGETHRFAQGLQSPRITFTRGQLLVAADVNEGRVSSIEGTRSLHAKFPTPDGSLIALLPTGQLNGFAAINAKGEVWVYQGHA